MDHRPVLTPTPSSVPDTPESTNGADCRPSTPGPPRLDWSDFDAKFGAFTIMLHSARPKKRKRRSSTQDALLQQQEDSLHETSDVDGERLSTSLYTVHPANFWEDTYRYKRATIDDAVVEIGDFVFVNNSETPEDDKEAEDAPVTDWIAKVLEVRAGSPTRVFLRVYWVFRPEDLLEGRQPHHGRCEVIPSNAMQIIDARTVNSVTRIQYWKENEESELLKPDELYWRQTLDDPTHSAAGKLSKIRTYCIDDKPFNPDTMLIHCPSCNNWLHGPCIEAEAAKSAEAFRTASSETPTCTGPSIPAPTSTVKRGRKKKAKPKDQPPEPLFSAQVRSTDDEKTKIYLTERRGDQRKTSEQPVYCLFEACGALIE